MPPRELAFRLRQRWRLRTLRLQMRDRPLSPETVAALAAHVPARCQSLLPGTGEDARAMWQSSAPEDFKAHAARAQLRAGELLGGTWRALGKQFHVTPLLDWHRDPLGAYRWPLRFFTDVPLYDLPETTDVKHIWELGRQQYVVDLALHAWLANDVPAAHRAGELIQSWIDANPAYQGVHWASGLEVAMRSISWIWCLALLTGRSHTLHLNHDALIVSLADHAEYLALLPSSYSSPYNHLIGEATGLLWIAHVIADHPRAGHWRSAAESLLAEHTAKQFYADGFSVEQAMGYHCFTLGFLVQARVALAQAGRVMASLDDVIARAAEVAYAFQQPSGLWPPLGDIDSARSIPLAPEQFWDFSDLLDGALTMCLERPSSNSSGHLPRQTSIGLPQRFMLGSHQLSENVEAANVHTGRVLPTSGYAVSPPTHPSGDWMLFRAGPLGAGLHADSTPSVAHGHADPLQVLWWQGGQAVLVDGGMRSYAGSLESLDAVRNPCGHNTLEIDGLPIARRAGRLAWSHVIDRIQLEACIAPDVWVAKGCIQLARDVAVTRYVLALPTVGLWIADRISGAMGRHVRWYWQLAPEIASQAALRSDLSGIAWDLGSLVAQASEPWTQFRLLPEASGEPILQSPEYGVSFPSRRVISELVAGEETLALAHVAACPSPARFIVRNRAIGPLASDEPAIRRLAAQAEAIWQVESNAETVTIAVGIDSQFAGQEMSPLTGVGTWPVAIGRTPRASNNPPSMLAERLSGG